MKMTRWIVAHLIPVGLLLAQSEPTARQQSASDGYRPASLPFRWAELGSYLSALARPADGWAPLTSFSRGRPGWFLTRGGEIRKSLDFRDQNPAGPAEQNVLGRVQPV